MYRYTDKVRKIYTYNIHKSNKLVIGQHGVGERLIKRL